MNRRAFVSGVGSIVALPFLSFLTKKTEASEGEFFTGCVRKANGDKEWYQDGKLHRLDGPVVECVSGDKHWYQDGELHRLDGPAVEYANGDKWWYQDGKYVKSE